MVRLLSSTLVTSPGNVNDPVSVNWAVSLTVGPPAGLQLFDVAQLCPPVPVQDTTAARAGPWPARQSLAGGWKRCLCPLRETAGREKRGGVRLFRRIKDFADADHGWYSIPREARIDSRRSAAGNVPPARVSSFSASFRPAFDP